MSEVPSWLWAIIAWLTATALIYIFRPPDTRGEQRKITRQYKRRSRDRRTKTTAKVEEIEKKAEVKRAEIQKEKEELETSDPQKIADALNEIWKDDE